jgi:hypothetical protein
MFAHEIHEKRETLRIKTSADFAFCGPFVLFRMFSREIGSKHPCYPWSRLFRPFVSISVYSWLLLL